ncbi:MAG: DUF4190 domain-containing protein [Phycisphaerales bacterium]
MRNDPYAKDAYGFDGEPQRTSAMAVTSLVTSLGCCLPGVGLLAAMFGVLALGLIGQSQGRLSGRGPAAVGIILGLIGTVIWGAIGVGGLQAWTFYTKQMAPVAERAMLAAASGDLTALQAELTPDAAGDLDPAHVRFFIDTIESEQGAIQSIETDFSTTIEAFERIYGNMQQPPQGGAPGPGGQGSFAPVPVTLRCANGDVLAWPIFDEDGFSGSQVLLVDIMVQMPDLKAVSLRADGPAAAFAPAFGWQVVLPESTDETPAPDASAAPTEPAPDEG